MFLWDNFSNKGWLISFETCIDVIELKRNETAKKESTEKCLHEKDACRQFPHTSLKTYPGWPILYTDIWQIWCHPATCHKNYHDAKSVQLVGLIYPKYQGWMCDFSCLTLEGVGVFKKNPPDCLQPVYHQYEASTLWWRLASCNVGTDVGTRPDWQGHQVSDIW